MNKLIEYEFIPSAMTQANCTTRVDLDKILLYLTYCPNIALSAGNRVIYLLVLLEATNSTCVPFWECVGFLSNKDFHKSYLLFH